MFIGLNNMILHLLSASLQSSNATILIAYLILISYSKVNIHKINPMFFKYYNIANSSV